MFRTLCLLLLVTLTSGVPLTRYAERGDAWWGSALSDEATGYDVADGTAGHEAVGMCKATCIQELLNWPPSDDLCLANRECVMCWQMCELLHQSEEKYRQKCVDADCNTGCSLACDFDFAGAKTGVVDSSWEFPSEPVTVERSDKALSMSWPLPARQQDTPTYAGAVLPVFLVYTLLFRDDNHPYWSKATSTVDLETEVTGEHKSFSGLRFLLLASSTRGTVCLTHPPYPGIKPDTTDVTPVKVTPAKVVPVTQRRVTVTVPPFPGAPTPAEPIVPRWDPTIFTDNSPDQNQRKTGSALFPSADDVAGRLTSLTVYVEVNPDNGELLAVLTWHQELLKPLPLLYFVTWGRHSCNVNPAAPYCPLVDEEITAEVDAREGEEMKMVLSQMTYNSRYRLDVALEGDSPQQVFFYTPVCGSPEHGFTVCPENRRVKTTPTTTTTTSTTSSTTTTPTTPSPTPDSVDKPVQYSYDVNETPSDWSNELTLVVLSAAVSAATLLIVLVGMCVYRKVCHRPDPNEEMLKVMQSYASLPLLNSTLSQAGSAANLHRIHQQALLQSSLLQYPAGHASLLQSPASMYCSADGLNHSTLVSSAPGFPQTTVLPPLPPLRNIHLGVSSFQQTTPSEPDHAPAPASTPRMGTRMNVTENPLCALPEDCGLLAQGALHNPALAALVAAQGSEYRSRSMESLNRVSAELGLPRVTRKATSTADLVLHGWEQGPSIADS